MKKYLAWFCLLFVVPLNTFAGETKGASIQPNLVIVYTGDGRLKIEPTGCCSKIGGMSRRATRIAEIRERYPNVLVLDSGDYLRDSPKEPMDEIRPRHVHKALSRIGYDALNIAGGELMAGETFLSLFASEPSMPLISANIKFANTNWVPQWSPFQIKTLGGVRISIIGIASKADTSMFTVTDPIMAISGLLPALESQADIIVLLSHLKWDQTKSLVQDNPSIDLAIVGYDNFATFDPETVGESLMVKNAFDGGVLGIVKVWTTPQRQITRIEGNIELIDNQIRPRPEYQVLESDYNAEKIAFKKRIAEENSRKKIDGFLKMSPHQFLEYVKKNNGKIE